MVGSNTWAVMPACGVVTRAALIVCGPAGTDMLSVLVTVAGTPSIETGAASRPPTTNVRFPLPPPARQGAGPEPEPPQPAPTMGAVRAAASASVRPGRVRMRRRLS
ncbi:MAG TPA: hypothetical protein VKQ32_21585 [Polyangia bacterium]|nr:hypothetical protein [Polyangia bacterium]